MHDIKQLSVISITNWFPKSNVLKKHVFLPIWFLSIYLGSIIGKIKWKLLLCRVRQLAFVAYVHTPTCIGLRYMILDMRTLTSMLFVFSMIFESFQIILILIILYWFRRYCYIFDLFSFSLEETDCLRLIFVLKMP